MVAQEIIPVLTQFGAAGLIGALWIVERRHAMVRDRQLDEAHKSITQLRTEAESLLTVVKENTRAITSLEGSQRQLARLLESLSAGRDSSTAERPVRQVGMRPRRA